MRAVIDANVFVSGVIGNGIPRGILEAMIEKQFDLIASEVVLAEIGRVLRYSKVARRHKWSEVQVQVYMESLRGIAFITPGLLKLAVVSADPTDDRYLECAVEGEADCVVTGDRHLLDLGDYRGIEILEPREFLGLLSPRRKR